MDDDDTTFFSLTLLCPKLILFLFLSFFFPFSLLFALSVVSSPTLLLSSFLLFPRSRSRPPSTLLPPPIISLQLPFTTSTHSTSSPPLSFSLSFPLHFTPSHAGRYRLSPDRTPPLFCIGVQNTCNNKRGLLPVSSPFHSLLSCTVFVLTALATCTRLSDPLNPLLLVTVSPWTIIRYRPRNRDRDREPGDTGVCFDTIITRGCRVSFFISLLHRAYCLGKVDKQGRKEEKGTKEEEEGEG